MTPVLPELSDDLAAAAERLVVSPASGRRGGRRRGRFVAFATVAVLGAGGVAAAATSLWNPQVGDGSHPASIARDAPPQAQLDALGVLRRPQTDVDRGASSEYVLRFFGDRRGVRLEYVRRLGTRTGQASYVLVPAASEGTGELVRLRALKARRDGRTVPPPTSDPLCLFARDPGGGGGLATSCFSLQEVLEGRAVMGWSGRRGRSTQFGLVTDAVARVRGGEGPDAPVVEVRDNFFEITTPSGMAALHFLDADGRELARTPSG